MDCSICDRSAYNCRQCDGDGMVLVDQQRLDEAESEVPSEELRLFAGLSMVDDEYYE